MLVQNRLDDGLLCQRLALLGHVFAFRFVVINVEAQDIAVVDGVGDGVGVQLLLEDVCSGLEGGLLTIDLLIGGILLKDRRAGEAEKLGVGEKFLDGLVVLAELRAVAFVEDEHHALVAQRLQLLLVGGLALLLVFLVALAVFVQGQAELLDGGDNHLVGIVVGEEPSHQGAGVWYFPRRSLPEIG